jgi:2-succinyl-6-hydroxy-2,4-cyclohexadiene-1-carboxylate synthase
MKLWCLHGFLSRPSDWDFLRDAGFDVEAIDVFGGDPLRELEAASADDAILGYSMGGRIALEAMLARPFAKAVIVAAGLNIEDEAERATRLAADERWARRFERDAWSAVVGDWNAQPLFAHDRPMNRRESDYDRGQLAEALRIWSPARRPPLVARLPEIATPILWIVGSEDTKYVAVARHATSRLPHATLACIEGAGHRVAWQQPAQFIEEVRRFLAR